MDAFLAGERRSELAMFDVWLILLGWYVKSSKEMKELANVTASPHHHQRATCCAVHLQAVYSRSCRCRCDASLVGCLERLITLAEITEALCLAWEVLIEIAAILHCCEAMSPYCGGAPFGITSGSTVSAVQRININIPPNIHTVAMPGQLYCQHTWANGSARQICCGVAVCSPAFGRFPAYDGFIAYYNPSYRDIQS